MVSFLTNFLPSTHCLPQSITLFSEWPIMKELASHTSHIFFISHSFLNPASCPYEIVLAKDTHIHTAAQFRNFSSQSSSYSTWLHPLNPGFQKSFPPLSFGITFSSGSSPTQCPSLTSDGEKLRGFPRWLSGKEFACNAGEVGSIPWWGRSHGKGHGNPLRYSCLENSMDRYSPWGLKELDTTEVM